MRGCKPAGWPPLRDGLLSLGTHARQDRRGRISGSALSWNLWFGAGVPPSNGPKRRSFRRVHRIATFNLGSDHRQVSVLRLVNRGSEATTATVTGADDRGVRPGDPVEVLVPAGRAVELTAAELESGMAGAITSGALGDGAGKWRLRVASEGDLAVMGLLRSPIGHSRMRAEWEEVPGVCHGVEPLLDGAAVRSMMAAARTDFAWDGLEPGTYSVRVRWVNADGVAGPWGEPSNEVAVD